MKEIGGAAVEDETIGRRKKWVSCNPFSFLLLFNFLKVHTTLNDSRDICQKFYCNPINISLFDFSTPIPEKEKVIKFFLFKTKLKNGIY